MSFWGVVELLLDGMFFIVSSVAQDGRPSRLTEVPGVYDPGMGTIGGRE